MTDCGSMQTFWAEQFIYIIIVVLTKVSIVLLYLRIFPRGVSNTFTYSCWAAIGVLIAYGIAMCIFFAMQCRPIRYVYCYRLQTPQQLTCFFPEATFGSNGTANTKAHASTSDLEPISAARSTLSWISSFSSSRSLGSFSSKSPTHAAKSASSSPSSLGCSSQPAVSSASRTWPRSETTQTRRTTTTTSDYGAASKATSASSAPACRLSPARSCISSATKSRASCPRPESPALTLA